MDGLFVFICVMIACVAELDANNGNDNQLAVDNDSCAQIDMLWPAAKISMVLC